MGEDNKMKCFLLALCALAVFAHAAPCHYATDGSRGSDGDCYEGHTAAGQCNLTSASPTAGTAGTCASVGFTLCCEIYGMGHNWIQLWFQMPRTCDDGSRGPYASHQCNQTPSPPTPPAPQPPAPPAAPGVPN